MRTDTWAVYVGSGMGNGTGSSAVMQICSRRGSAASWWRNHWYPTFLTTFFAAGVERPVARAMKRGKQLRRSSGGLGSRLWGRPRHRRGVAGRAPTGACPLSEATGWPAAAEPTAATRTNVRAAPQWWAS